MFDPRRFTRRHLLQSIGGSLLGLTLPPGLVAQTADEPPLPPRREADRLDGPPIVSARAWAIGDGRTGRVLWGDHEADALAMASTTKIMTAWLVLQRAADNPQTLDEMVTVSQAADDTTGSSAQIRTGDRYTVRDLLYGLLLPSGNDAAVAFAEHFGPSFRTTNPPAPPVAAFVARMNEQAEILRLTETRYLDPHGLGQNRTSARNLITLAWNAMQNPTFRQIVQTRRHRCEASDANGQRRPVVWNNTNRLLEIEGYEGIKTGTTTAAGSCLVASGRRGNDHLFVVVLGATSNDSRYIDTRNLFRWAWNQPR